MANIPATPEQEAAYAGDKKIVRANYKKAYQAYKAAQKAPGVTREQQRANRKFFWQNKGAPATAGLTSGRARGTDLAARTGGTGLRASNRPKYGFPKSITWKPGTKVTQAGAAYTSAQVYKAPTEAQQRRFGDSMTTDSGTQPYVGGPTAPGKGYYWDSQYGGFRKSSGMKNQWPYKQVPARG